MTDFGDINSDLEIPSGKSFVHSDTPGVFETFPTITVAQAHINNFKAIVDVVDESSPYTLLEVNTGGVYTNVGADDIVHFDLPLATITGLFYTFKVIAEQYIEIDPHASQKISTRNILGDAGAYIRSNNVRSVVMLIFDGVDTWHSVHTLFDISWTFES